MLLGLSVGVLWPWLRLLPAPPSLPSLTPPPLLLLLLLLLPARLVPASAPLEEVLEAAGASVTEAGAAGAGAGAAGTGASGA